MTKREMLLAEAKRRFPKKTRFNNSNILGKKMLDLTSDSLPRFWSTRELVVDGVEGGTWTVYRDGKWADVIIEDLVSIVDSLDTKIQAMEQRLDIK